MDRGLGDRCRENSDEYRYCRKVLGPLDLSRRTILSNDTGGIQQVTASRNLANQDRPCDSPGLPGSSPRFTLINAAGRVTGGVFFFCTSLLFAADARVDHATVCGADLTRMQAALKSAGIDTVYGRSEERRVGIGWRW